MDLQKSFNKSKVSEAYTLSPIELKEFHSELQSIIWVIQIEESFDRKPTIIQIAIGFSVDSLGSVLTCWHIFAKDATSREIRMRRLHENDFCISADLVYHRPKWDLAMLQVKNVGDYCFGKFATEESISVGEMLLHIGHPANFVGSFLVGRAVYPCRNVLVPTGSRQTCGQYSSTSLYRKSDFRVMGDAWNSELFDTCCALQLSGFEKNLHPLIPIIQISGLVARGGCSGGPVFNTRGEIVGLLQSLVDGYEIATHVAMLKHFMKEYEENVRASKR